MSAEHAPIGVEFVDDDDPQLLEELVPLGVMGEDRGVEHVRVGDDDLTGRTDSRPDGRRGISVIRGRRDVQRRGTRELTELGDLVLPERLGREEEQGAGGRIVGDGLQGRDRIAERLAGGGRRHDDHVFTRMDRVHRRRLMVIGSLDAARRQTAHDPWIQPRRELREGRRAGGDDLVVDHAARDRRFGKQIREHGLRVGWRVGAHHEASNSTDVRKAGV